MGYFRFNFVPRAKSFYFDTPNIFVFLQVVSLLHTLLSHEETEVRTVMVVCPLSTVLNWYNEFDKWLKDVEGGDTIDVYHLTK